MLASAAAWYVALTVVGFAGLVPAVVLFERLASRGVFFARPFGLALTALVAWLAVALTPIPHGTPTVLAAVGALLGVSVGLAWWRRDVVPAIRARWRSMAAAEGVTLLVFALVLWARVLAPDAWATEKPADLMLLNAVHHAQEFPPLDPWLAGERLSYYHLGHLQADIVTRLSGETPATAFNLATATAGALAGAAAVGLALDLVRMGGARRRAVLVVAGSAAVALLLLAAPLVGLVQIASANGLGGAGAWGWLGIGDVPAREGASTLVPEQFWWWWPTTRVVPDVISEYPGFSLVLGDPHPHLLAQPLGLVALALAVQVFEGSTPLGWRRWLARPEQLVLTSALLAALLMTNAWDVITYGGLLGLAAWWSASRAGWPSLLAGFLAARWLMVPAGIALAIAWPFLGTLDPQPLGFAPVVGEHSDPGRWLLFWAPLLGVVVAGLTAGWRPRPQHMLDAATFALIPVGIWIAWILWRGEGDEILARGSGWITILGLVGAIGWCGGAVVAEPLGRRGEAGALFVVSTALGLLLLTELVHIDDAFSGRLNTAFKFWYHAWVLLAVGGAALVALGSRRMIETVGNRPRVWSVPRGWALVRRAGVLVLSIVTAATMVTPPMAAVARAREGQEPGLSSIGYLDRVDPGFADAIRWAERTLIPGEAVVSEAISESYSSGSRFSAFTGIPTVLGWPGHERQWHGTFDETGRRAAVDAIYAGTPDELEQAVGDWDVTHVLVGPEERAQYGVDVAARFAEWPLAFSSASVAVYGSPYPADTDGAAR